MANEYITRQAVQDTARAILKDPILIMAVDAVAKAAPGVEVVRCKDCQNSKVEQMSIPGDDLSRQFPMYVCEHPRGEVGTDPLYMEADDFCSYGERRHDNA